MYSVCCRQISVGVTRDHDDHVAASLCANFRSHRQRSDPTPGLLACYNCCLLAVDVSPAVVEGNKMARKPLPVYYRMTCTYRYDGTYLVHLIIASRRAVAFSLYGR